jgi:DNA replication protein DnaC
VRRPRRRASPSPSQGTHLSQPYTHRNGPDQALTLNKTLVLELARCELLARRENVLLLGNSGTGKTNIALALGLAACQRGHRVRFTAAAALVHELIEARDEKKLLRFQKQIQL